MVDLVAELAGGIVELAIDLLLEPWISKLMEKRKQKKEHRLFQIYSGI